MVVDKKQKKILIIGAGISGLASGIFGQKKGFVTEILEKNPRPGGLCTAWNRKDFLVDGCIHWMTGTKEGTSICNMWHECGAFEHENIIYSDDFGIINCKGTNIKLYCDLNKLEKELIDISPVDEKIIKRTINYIIKFQNMPLPVDLPISTMNIFRLSNVGISMIPYLKDYLYASHKSVKNYSLKFKSEKLRYLLTHIVPGDGNLYSTLFAFGTVAVKNGGVPKGGSLSLINNMVNEYKNNGGIIKYNHEVESILIENNKAVGVLLKNGSIEKADYIISSCDCITSLDHILDNKYIIKGFEKRKYNYVSYPTQSCVLITFSVNKNLIDKLLESHTYEFECDKFTIGKRTESSIRLRKYSYDDTFTRNGKTILNILVPQSDEDYFYWKKLKENPRLYKNEKQKIVDILTKQIFKELPELVNELDLLDVATPCTFERYTNAYHGAYMPFAYTSKGSMFYYQGYVKGIRNLQISGQWSVLPGGLPIAMMSGKFAIQRILKNEHKPFVFSKKIKYKYSK